MSHEGKDWQQRWESRQPSQVDEAAGCFMKALSLALVLGVGWAVVNYGVGFLGRWCFTESVYEKPGLEIRRYRWNSEGYRISFEGGYRAYKVDVPNDALLFVRKVQMGERSTVVALAVKQKSDSVNMPATACWRFDVGEGIRTHFESEAWTGSCTFAPER